MQKRKAISIGCRVIPLALAAAALLCSCTNTLSEEMQKPATGGGYGQFENSEGGTLTVTARVSTSASRYAMPSIPELVYAALLYEDDEIPENLESKDFVQGTETEDGKLIFSFQRPDDTSGTFTLKIFAFEKTDVVAEDGTANFSRNSALFSGYKEGLAIVGDAIVVTDPIALSSNESGTVNLKIKVPDGCTLELKELKIDGTTEGNPHFAITGASPNFTIKQNDENGILAGAYQVTFTVKKDEEIIYIFSEYINVINGLCTNTWWNGDVSSEVKDVSQSMSKTVYVRGTDGWYDVSDYKDTATASDENSGSFLAPLATIQKAIDKIVAINDGASAYTIYLDGTFTATSSAALADFNAFSQTQKLSVKIAGFSASQKAVLDGGDMACGIVAGKPLDSSAEQKNMNLTLENLVIQNAKNPGSTIIRGGAIMLCCKADNLHTIKNCEIKNNRAAYGSAIYNEYGSLDLQNCVINDNKTTTSGTVYIGQESAILTMSDVNIENNSAANGGAVFLAYNATVKISDASVVIKNNSASGGDSRGPGINLWNGYLELSGSAKIDDIVGLYGGDTHEIVISGELIGSSPVATIAPSVSNYVVDGKVLSAGTDVTITQDICDKFAITPQDDGTEWKIVPDGANGVLKTTSVYVRGSDATWYENNNPTATASDTNAGTRSKPLATIQKAVEKIIDMNDGADNYTIYVDGMLDGTTASNIDTDGMADFSALTKNLTLTIKALSETAKATIDGGARFGADSTVAAEGIKKSIIYAKPAGGTLALTLENLVITGGNTTDDGGGICYQSTGGILTVKGCTISGNTAGGSGGGIYFDPASGTLTMNKCEISGNISKGTLDGGGGIYNKGTLTMEDCTISENKVKWYGGGVYNSGTLTITGGTISDNTTWYSGGGIYNNGGTATITGCTIKSCKVEVPGTLGDYRYGGAGIYITGGGSLTAEGCEITENTIIAPMVVYGAGVYVYEGTFIMEDGTKISKNRADWEGGGVYVAYSGSTFIMNGGEISGNHGVLRGDELSAEYKASVGGGGVCISRGGAFTMNHGSITGNTSGTVGGGVYVSNDSYGAGTFTMKGGAISGNTASEDGGGVYVYQEPSSYTAMFTMEDGTISGNTAGGDGGGVALKGGMFILESGTISINKAVYGAGIHVSGGGTFAMENGTISGNIADGKNDSGGGGIHLFNGTVEMSGGEIIENHAKGTAEGAGGGGIYIYHSNVNTFTMTGTAKISNNDAVRHGGGVYQGAGSNFTSNIMGNISGNNPDEVYNEP